MVGTASPQQQARTIKLEWRWPLPGAPVPAVRAKRISDEQALYRSVRTCMRRTGTFRDSRYVRLSCTRGRGPREDVEHASLEWSAGIEKHPRPTLVSLKLIHYLC